MDDKRFDSITKALASGVSRRSVFKGLFGLGGTALTGAVVIRDDAAEAARRPTPTPKAPKCPGNQTWNGAKCVCPANLSQCGPSCCNDQIVASGQPGYSTCCDNACCQGTCYGEERCCATNNRPGGLPPTERICRSLGGTGCCRFSDECCTVDGCCSTSCYGGNDGVSFCCPANDWCPGGSTSSELCCEGAAVCCGKSTTEHICADLTSDDDNCGACGVVCSGCTTCQNSICTPNDEECEGTEVCCPGGVNTGVCDTGPNCGCDSDADCAYLSDAASCTVGHCQVVGEVGTCVAIAAASTVICHPAGSGPNAICDPAVMCDGQTRSCPDPHYAQTGTNCGDCMACNANGVCIAQCDGDEDCCPATDTCVPHGATCCVSDTQCTQPCQICDEQLGYCADGCSGDTLCCVEGENPGCCLPAECHAGLGCCEQEHVCGDRCCGPNMHCCDNDAGEPRCIALSADSCCQQTECNAMLCQECRNDICTDRCPSLGRVCNGAGTCVNACVVAGNPCSIDIPCCEGGSCCGGICIPAGETCCGQSVCRGMLCEECQNDVCVDRCSTQGQVCNGAGTCVNACVVAGNPCNPDFPCCEGGTCCNQICISAGDACCLTGESCGAECCDTGSRCCERGVTRRCIDEAACCHDDECSYLDDPQNCKQGYCAVGGTAGASQCAARSTCGEDGPLCCPGASADDPGGCAALTDICCTSSDVCPGSPSTCQVGVCESNHACSLAPPYCDSYWCCADGFCAANFENSCCADLHCSSQDACTPAQCIGHTCKTGSICESPLACCGGPDCVDTSIDDNNCGRCGNHCSTALCHHCQNGECTEICTGQGLVCNGEGLCVSA